MRKFSFHSKSTTVRYTIVDGSCKPGTNFEITFIAFSTFATTEHGVRTRPTLARFSFCMVLFHVTLKIVRPHNRATTDEQKGRKMLCNSFFYVVQ